MSEKETKDEKKVREEHELKLISDRLVTYQALSKVTGRPIRVRGGDLSMIVTVDGRAERRITRAVLAQGWLKPCVVDGQVMKDVFEPTDVPYQLATESKPDLFTYYSGNLNRGERLSADLASLVDLSKLSTGEQKYVVEHPEEYIWYRQMGWNKPELHVFGTRGPEGNVCLTSKEAIAQALDAIVTERTEALLGQNLFAGLEHFGLLSKEEMEAYTSATAGSFPTSSFTVDVAKFFDGLPDKAKRLEEKLEKVKRGIEICTLLTQRIETYGGWEKFLADYRVELRASVEADLNPDIKPEEMPAIPNLEAVKA